MADVLHTEDEFIFDKKMVCPVCDKPFTTKVLKSNRARRLGADADLRPRFEYIDTLKYGVCSCPNCGYSAMHSAFPNVVSRQIANIKEQVCTHFLPENRSGWTVYTYDQAIAMNEMALRCAEAKMAKDGEKSYLHMVISWLYREKEKEAENISDEALRAQQAEYCHSKAESHYMEAFEGFQRAMMNEMTPIMGLNQPTLEYIIAYMAFHFGKLEVAAKLIGSVLTTSSASRNVKDRALELKDEIIRLIKEKKSGAK
ncbi:MAG: DUF2225 domain-containing protein [Eubacterium sp.]|nr:DUF2225 domain-containing protein [Eubacterium sp.]